MNAGSMSVNLTSTKWLVAKVSQHQEVSNIRVHGFKTNDMGLGCSSIRTIEKR